MGAKDEPSNPFKNPRKSTNEPRNSPRGGRKGGRPRGQSGPPVPPGKKSTAPPIAPSGGKKTTPSKPTAPAAPARAGKSVGLRKKSQVASTDAQKKTDERARELIEATRVKATETQLAKDEVKTKKEPSNPFKKQAKPSGQQRRGGRQGKRNRPQGPTKRVKKLDQGKSMEFKYDLRRILDEEGVEDEHRSNVLSQTMAKGQRQGVDEAKSYLDDKLKAGVITESCYARIEKLIDSLTTRR